MWAIYLVQKSCPATSLEQIKATLLVVTWICIAYIPNISCDRAFIGELAHWCNVGRISPMHLLDVVLDALSWWHLLLAWMWLRPRTLLHPVCHSQCNPHLPAGTNDEISDMLCPRTFFPKIWQEKNAKIKTHLKKVGIQKIQFRKRMWKADLCRWRQWSPFHLNCVLYKIMKWLILLLL